MVEGGVAKFLAEVTLLGQPFVKGDGKATVEQLLKAQGATVNGFVLFVVGEGIEKRKDDFAAEVAAMTKGPEHRDAPDPAPIRHIRYGGHDHESARRRRSDCRRCSPSVGERSRLIGASCSSCPARR